MLSYDDRPTTVPVHSQYHDFNVINMSLGPPAKISNEKHVLDFCQIVKVL